MMSEQLTENPSQNRDHFGN